MYRTAIAATLAVASAWARPTSARGEPKQPTGCTRPLDAEAVVRCALAASPDIREARERLAALAGRRTTAAIWLPSNPTVGATVAARRRPAPEAVSVLNWRAVLSQELEVAAGALAAYCEAVAAGESLQFVGELAQNAQALAIFAEARAKEALLAGVEADVARAEATRIGLLRFEAERRLAEHRENKQASLSGTVKGAAKIGLRNVR